VKVLKVGAGVALLLFAFDASATPDQVCVKETVKERQKTERLGIIEGYSEKTFGSMEGTIGAILGGILGAKIDGGNDATMVLGTVIGNKLGNDVKRKKQEDSLRCYEVVREV
jgi:uncharacterized protein YcfJ